MDKNEGAKPRRPYPTPVALDVLEGFETHEAEAIHFAVKRFYARENLEFSSDAAISAAVQVEKTLEAIETEFRAFVFGRQPETFRLPPRPATWRDYLKVGVRARGGLPWRILVRLISAGAVAPIRELDQRVALSVFYARLPETPPPGYHRIRWVEQKPIQPLMDRDQIIAEARSRVEKRIARLVHELKLETEKLQDHADTSPVAGADLYTHDPDHDER